MPSTFVHGLLPAACALYTFRNREPLTRWQWAQFFFLSALLGNFPDLDIIPASLFPADWRHIHRNWGHNIFILPFLVAVGAWLTHYLTPLRGSTAWIFSGALVLSHLVLDSLMGYSAAYGGRPGVPLFWPLTSQSYSLPWPVFACVDAKPGSHPLLSFATSPEFWAQHVFREAIASALLFVLWAASAWCTRGFNALRERLFGSASLPGSES